MRVFNRQNEPKHLLGIESDEIDTTLDENPSRNEPKYLLGIEKPRSERLHQ